MESAPLLALYARAWAITQAMLEAAQGEDWDTLVTLSYTRDPVFIALGQAAPVARENLSLAAETATLIRNILAADEQIQSLSRAWMDEISGVLTSVQVERKLLKAYEAV